VKRRRFRARGYAARAFVPTLVLQREPARRLEFAILNTQYVEKTVPKWRDARIPRARTETF